MEHGVGQCYAPYFFDVCLHMVEMFTSSTKIKLTVSVAHGPLDGAGTAVPLYGKGVAPIHLQVHGNIGSGVDFSLNFVRKIILIKLTSGKF